jgi:hypothetical protein
MEDFGDDLRCLRDRHSGTVEEEIAVCKCDVAFAYCMKLTPPGVSL